LGNSGLDEGVGLLSFSAAMNTKSRSVRSLWLMVAALTCLGGSQGFGEVIFADNFDGSGPLNGAVPDIRPGAEAWVAAGQFGADGSVGGSPTSGGSATLAFVPVHGRIYTLEARLSATSTAGNNDWLAIGFSKGQGTVSSVDYRFIINGVVGRSWMLFRGSSSPTVPDHAALLGVGTGSNSGTASNVNWVDWTSGTGGRVELRIVLDTTGGTGAWKSTWYARRPGDAEYITVRPTASMLAEDITSVGIAKANTAVTGAIESFKLTSAGGETAVPVLRIRQNAAALDFAWESSPGMKYDLVSHTELAMPISDWPIYHNGPTVYGNILGTGATIELQGVATAGARRFFALVQVPNGGG
jgi:hypothetical protein